MEASIVIRGRNASVPQKVVSVRMSTTVTRKILILLQVVSSRQAQREAPKGLTKWIGYKERGKQPTGRHLPSMKRCTESKRLYNVL